MLVLGMRLRFVSAEAKKIASFFGGGPGLPGKKFAEDGEA